MKKNISINLYGTLYNIDDDAYALLDNYLKSMQRCFNRENGGEEVADDIEHRVAELLWQRKEAGMEAVSIEMVKEIIATIGKPEEIGGEEDNAQEEEAETQAESEKESQKHRFFEASVDFYSKRKLYRSSDDRKIAGICSGLATYFDVGSPLMWRLAAVLIAVLLLCAGGSVFFLLLAYLLLWILVPRAVTPEDRLRMLGKEVTPNNVAQQVVSDTGRVVQRSRSSKWVSRILKGFLLLAVVCFAVPMLLLVLVVLVGLIVLFVNGVPMALSPICDFTGLASMLPWVSSARPWAIILLVCSLLVLLLPIVGILCSIFCKKRMPRPFIVSGVVAWVLAVTASISCAIFLALSAASYEQNMNDQSRLRTSIRFMQQIGWSLEESLNLKPDFIETNDIKGNLPYYCFRLRPNHRSENDGAYSAVFKMDVSLPESGTYTFMSLTQETHADLTYTFRYTSGGEEKEVVLHPAKSGISLRNGTYEDYDNYDFGFAIDSVSWENFVNHGGDKLVYSIDVENVDAGSGTVTIAARMCMDPVKIYDVKVVKK